jgi:hypothetical protein
MFVHMHRTMSDDERHASLARGQLTKRKKRKNSYEPQCTVNKSSTTAAGRFNKLSSQLPDLGCPN